MAKNSVFFLGQQIPRRVLGNILVLALVAVGGAVALSGLQQRQNLQSEASCGGCSGTLYGQIGDFPLNAAGCGANYHWYQCQSTGFVDVSRENAYNLLQQKYHDVDISFPYVGAECPDSECLYLVKVYGGAADRRRCSSLSGPDLRCVSGGTGGQTTPQPTTPTEDTCSAGGDCFTGINNCGDVGRDLAAGDNRCLLSGAAGFCCTVRPDLRPAPQIVSVGATLSSRKITIGGKTRINIKPTVKAYDKLRISLSAEEIIVSQMGGRTDAAREIGFGPEKRATWVIDCPSSGSAGTCDGQTFSVDIYGLDKGSVRVKVKLSATNENGTSLEEQSPTMLVN